MAREILEEISPEYVGEDRIVVSLVTVSPIALSPVILEIDYEQAGDEGVILPIEVIVQPPSIDGSGYSRRVFRHSTPQGFVWTPITTGPHLVLVREVGHNRWQGRLVVQVAGDTGHKIETVERV